MIVQKRDLRGTLDLRIPGVTVEDVQGLGEDGFALRVVVPAVSSGSVREEAGTGNGMEKEYVFSFHQAQEQQQWKDAIQDAVVRPSTRDLDPSFSNGGGGGLMGTLLSFIGGRSPLSYFLLSCALSRSELSLWMYVSWLGGCMFSTFLIPAVVVGVQHHSSCISLFACTLLIFFSSFHG